MRCRYLSIVTAALLLAGCHPASPEPVVTPEPDPVVTPEPGPVQVPETAFVYEIHPDRELGSISPLIYGINVLKGTSHTEKDVSTLVRLGGNRLTGYNWENNASNAGSDWYHHSDGYLVSSVVEGSRLDEPGSVAETFVRNCLSHGQTPLVTVPICYRVAADMDGTVAEGDDSRWIANLPRKEGPLSATPDLGDGAVYADEMVHFLAEVKGFKGKVAYSLDNEPDLWHYTHPRICPEHISCQEFLDRTLAFASAIKDVDPDARVQGFASFGYSGFTTFCDAPDWPQVREEGGYSWFIDYFLDRIARAGAEAGRPLVDVLDLHWYPEAKGDHRVTQGDANTMKDRLARLQAPRSLWDPSYKEVSWITQSSGYRLPLLPEVRASIDRYAPGTKLSISEFAYGGGEDITGAIALSEVLGIFGQYGIWSAAHWGDPGPYGWLAYRIFRNYDGEGSCYGDTLVESALSEQSPEHSSVFASTDAAGALHIIVTNKKAGEDIDAYFKIDGGKPFSSGTMYRILVGKADLDGPEELTVQDGNCLVRLPALSVSHLVFR